MVSLLVKNKSSFMSRLLSSSCFDSFLLEEATIRMGVTFQIDGHLNKDFFDSSVWNDRQQRPYDLTPWADVRGYCHDCIKGKHAPSAFHFVLRLKPEYVGPSLAEVPSSAREAIGSLVINIRMSAPHSSEEDASGTADLPSSAGEQSSPIRIITSLSMKSFTMDKSAEPVWDRTMERFLSAKGIEFEEET